jgi:hypothetical protein
VICTAFGNGKKHDFRLFKENKVRWTEKTCGVTDKWVYGNKKASKKLQASNAEAAEKLGIELTPETGLGCEKRL